jgi:hypothetical protein
MRTTNEMLDDWVNHYITNEPTARAVVEILRRRWGWTILIDDMSRFEEQANENA